MSNVTLDRATREHLRLLISRERQRRLTHESQPLKVCAAANCDREFEPRVAHQRYCSPRCQWRSATAAHYARHKRPLPATMCPACGTEYQPNRRDQTFCSETCRAHAYHRLPHVKERNAERARVKRRRLREAQ